MVENDLEMVADVSSAIIGMMLIFVGALLLVALVIYIIMGITLFKFNKLKFGKGTALAWIPICNIYLMGKLTINKLVGWILVVGMFATGTSTVTINGDATTYSFLPQSIAPAFNTLYGIFTFIIFIMMLVKYFSLKKEKKNENNAQPVMEQPITQTVEPQPVVQPVMEQPITQTVEPQPVVQPVMEQPITQTVEPQPVVQPVMEQPITQTVEPQPVVQPVIEQPIAQTVELQSVAQPVENLDNNNQI